MTPRELQQWLVIHGRPVDVDGQIGRKTLAAIERAFSCKCADSVTAEDIGELARRLGCSLEQLRAIAAVESSGGGYDRDGRPKMLFERHIFHRLTDGAHGVSPFSNPNGGGYGESSWTKLSFAAARNPAAAFASASWGKFQVMGMHWKTLGYPSPIDLAYSTVPSEAGHYELLARYVQAFGLLDELRAISRNAEDCRAFAKGYNGPAYARLGYHLKLARAMSA